MKVSRRFRILHLLTSLAPGGAETNLLALLRHFDHNRFQHAVAFGGGGTLEPEYSKTEVQLLQLWPQPLCLRSQLAIPSMLRQLEEYAPDLIHSHLDVPNLLGLAAKHRLKCRLVLHFHGLGIIPRRMLPGRSISQWVWNQISRIYRHCDRAIPICSYQIPFLNRLGMRGGQIALIPNGITLEGAPKAASSQHDGYRFVNVASFGQAKNHSLLVRAFQRVSHELPLARLTLVGDGPMRPTVEQQVEALGLKDQISFMGMRRDVPDILAENHCFVLSSRWELQPITILEAMRASLPVIATNVGGVSDTVVDGVSGILVKPDDEKHLAQAMLSLATKPERSIELGTNGLKIVAERFSNVLVARKIEDEYLDLLKS